MNLTNQTLSIQNMRIYLKTMTFCVIGLSALNGSAQKISYAEDPASGNIISLRINDDESNMNWLINTDGSQYEWIGDKYQWGTVYFEAKEGTVETNVDRRHEGDDIVETYTFKNVSDKEIAVRNIGICTPFNDNYPDAATCMNGRCNAHVWAGGKSAYVNAMRMGGIGPHIGLLVTDGSINDYEVWERGQNKGWSNVRGVLAMCPPDITLKPGETYSLEWRIFTHDGDNFDKMILERGGTECAEKLMPALEAFNGNQPHYRLNDIAIRHRDGYWFGKRRLYGDVFPHYWSAITAAAFHYYAKATGKNEYQSRAERIVNQE